MPACAKLNRQALQLTVPQTPAKNVSSAPQVNRMKVMRTGWILGIDCSSLLFSHEAQGFFCLARFSKFIAMCLMTVKFLGA